MGIAERKLKEKKARIDAIKKHAGFLFQKKGFESTRMEDIANRAELSKATIYQYFKSKNDLLYEMMQERLTCLNKDLIEICRKHEDPLEALRMMMDRTYAFYIEDSDIYNLVIKLKASEIGKHLSSDKAGHLREIMGSNLRQIELILRIGLEKGIFREVDARVEAIIIWNVFMGIVLFQENRLDVGKKDYRKSTLDTALNRLIEGLKKE